MKVLDLFTGVGGFPLGLERSGMEAVAFCEIDPYCRSKLKKHWPDIHIYRDVKELAKLSKEEIHAQIGEIDIICGGFPCQPFSVAGKQRGKEDDRHLWPYMLQLIQTIRPTWIIGENVAGFIRMALDDVLFDLEGEGYTTQPFVVPACAVGAIHRRDRVWIIAHSESEQNRRVQQREVQPNIKSESDGVSSYSEHNGRNGSKDGQSNPQGNDRNKEGQDKTEQPTRSSCEGGNDADTAIQFSNGICSNGESSESQKPEFGNGSSKVNFTRRKFKLIGLPTQPAICHRDDGVSDRVARLKALGNAVVPQIPELIGRAIMEAQKNKEGESCE